MTDGITWRQPYVESAVFISWVRGADLEGDQATTSEHILKLAERGKFQITTSYLTIAEVFKKKGDKNQRLTDGQNGKILKFFESPFLIFVEVDRVVAEEANRLCRQYRPEKLMPCDAIHLASALRAKCDCLLTWDGPLLSVSHPNIRIERPRIVGQGDIDFDGTEA